MIHLTRCAVTRTMVDDIDAKYGGLRSHEITSTSLGCSGALRVNFSSWTKPKTTNGSKKVHTGLLTVNGALFLKLSWTYSQLEFEHFVHEKADVFIQKSAINGFRERIKQHNWMGPKSAMYSAWDLLTFVSSFCVHFGPKGERYCLQDFLNGHANAFGLAMTRVVVRKFSSSKHVAGDVKKQPVANTSSGRTEGAPSSPLVALEE
jgi:hypothetical protein